MGKRRKFRGPDAVNPSSRVLVTGSSGPSAPKGPAETGGDGDANSEIEDSTLALALRAVTWLASLRSRVGSHSGVGSEVQEALLDAARPLVAAQAARYEEDAAASKMAAVKAGNNAVNAKKRPFAATSRGGGVGDGDGEVEPLQGTELAAATRALQTLALKPDQLASKACKPLRSALHPLVEAQLQEEKASPIFRVTCMLGQRARWPEALRLLHGMRAADSQRRPKLGAYQRWVRELDVAEGDGRELAMLDAIMRVAAGFSPADAPAPAEGYLKQLPAFEPPRSAKLPNSDSTTALAASELPRDEVTPKFNKHGVEACEEEQPMSVVNKLSSLIKARRSEAAAKAASDGAAAPRFGPGSFTVIAHESAHERKPPNHYDLDIYTCSPQAFSLRDLLAPERHAVTGVQGAFVLRGVLSAQECMALRDASDAIGYRPDVPISSTLDERAHNVVVLASEEQNDALFNRVKDLLPDQLGGDKLFGINRRWRLYRYLAGNHYRKHLDGAWPSSGVRVGAGGQSEYVYDAYGGNTRSRLTFIVYLNDDFEGGATTFFVPSPSKEGELEARPVRPCTGCVTVFPHGDTGTPLLHEGSPVISGAKYLLRTDVVYVSPETPQALKEAKRLRGLARQLGGLGGAALEDEAQHEAHEEAEGPTKKRKVIKSRVKKGGQSTPDGEKGLGGKMARKSGKRRNLPGVSAHAGKKVRNSKGKRAKTPGSR